MWSSMSLGVATVNLRRVHDLPLQASSPRFPVRVGAGRAKAARALPEAFRPRHLLPLQGATWARTPAAHHTTACRARAPRAPRPAGSSAVLGTRATWSAPASWYAAIRVAISAG